MEASAPKPFVLQAIDALDRLDRRSAVELLRKDLQNPAGMEHWANIMRLAAIIGERSLEVEATQRYLRTSPKTLDRLLNYCQLLSRLGRTDEALDLLNTIPAQAQDHYSVLYFRGMAAREKGNFPAAESFFRRTLTVFPACAEAWLGLSVMKTFTSSDDRDIRQMEIVRPQVTAHPIQVSQFLCALGKAYADAGETAKASQAFDEGAEAMAKAYPYDGDKWLAFTQNITQTFTVNALKGLKASQSKTGRVIFVTGLPRSGTTLVEQILTAHSKVIAAGEINQTIPAFMPAGSFTLEEASAYEERSSSDDPWGDIAREYNRMVDEQFSQPGLVVDKSLCQSEIMGLLLHSLPDAKIVWLRRKPEDCALSIYRTHFLESMPWSWSVKSIAAFMRGEDRLHDHWARIFPDRILTVSYEELVANPETKIRQILAHVGLEEELQVFEPHKSKRSVMTASVAQVRQPISTARIGAADAYTDFVQAFRAAYYD